MICRALRGRRGRSGVLSQTEWTETRLPSCREWPHLDTARWPTAGHLPEFSRPVAAQRAQVNRQSHTGSKRVVLGDLPERRGKRSQTAFARILVTSRICLISGDHHDNRPLISKKQLAVSFAFSALIVKNAQTSATCNNLESSLLAK
jgi:hypothetical protein